MGGNARAPRFDPAQLPEPPPVANDPSTARKRRANLPYFFSGVVPGVPGVPGGFGNGNVLNIDFA